jgi:hypothetical protein
LAVLASLDLWSRRQRRPCKKGLAAMDPRLDDAENECVKSLAAHFEKGQFWRNFEIENALNLSPEKRNAVLTTMEEMGIITEVTHTTSERFFLYKITSKAVQFARARSEQEKGQPMDIVEQVKLTIRRKPIGAWVIIIFIVLTALFTLINQFLGVLKTLRIIE